MQNFQNSIKHSLFLCGVFVLLLFVPGFVVSGEIKQVMFLNKASITNGTTINLNDNYLYAEESGIYAGNVNSKRKSLVRLSYNREGRTDVSSASSWSFTVDYKVYKTGFELTTSETGTIVVNYTSGATVNVYENIKSHFAAGGYPDVTLKITSAPTVTGTPPADIRLELIGVTERYIDVGISNSPLINYNSTTSELAWDFVPGAESYDVEWTYIDYMDSHPTFTNPEDPFLYKTPVRINTSNHHYLIDQVYPKGTIYFRVRAVGRHLPASGNDFSNLKYSDWGYKPNTNPGTSPESYVISTSFESNKNWNYSAVYAEDGKNKKGIGYADGGGKSRQSIASMNSDNTVIVGDAKYDIEGRAVVSFLPTPVNVSDPLQAFNYKNLFNKNITGGEFDYDDFQLGAQPTAGTTGAGNYYSLNNSFQSTDAFAKYTDDAGGFVTLPTDDGGYPYTQVVYTRDNTGRVSQTTAGAGAIYLIGAGHELKYYYGTPNSTELYKMFGKNVGKSSHYKKNIAIDANGQISISYLDQEGRVIATSLAGESPDNLIALSSNVSDTVVASLNGSNVVFAADQISVSNNQIMNVLPNTTHNFTYDMNGVIYGGNISLQGLGFYVDSETPYYDSCKVFELKPICADCKYKLKVSVTDPDGLTVQIPDPNNGGALTNQLVVTFTNPNNPTCPEYPYVNQYSLSPLAFSINFTKIGTYQVYKELTLDTTGIYVDINAAIANAGLNDTYLEQLIDCYISHTDFSQCDVTCEQHCKSLVKAEHPTWSETSEDFINAVQACMQTECTETINAAITDAADTECEVMLDQMMIDVSPGGYEFAQTGSGGIDNGFWTRVSGKLTAYTYPTLPAEPSTSDLENENYIILLDNNGLLIRPLPALSDIKNPVYWQTVSANPEQWARQLAKAHREYCHYKTCISETPSNAYDVIVTQATSYSNADNLGYIDPMGLDRTFTIASLPAGVTVNYVASGIDPMFATQNTSTGTPYKRMWDILRKAFPHGSYTDIWHYVNDATSPPYNTTTGAGLAFTDANKWLVFRGLYLDKKLALRDSIDEENDINRTCNFFTDEYANVFPSTSLNPNSATVNAIYNGINDCGERCELNLLNWMDQLQHYVDSVPCTSNWASLSATEIDEIKYNLLLYCQSECGPTNPGGLITDAMLSTPINTYLQNVLNILTSNGFTTGACSAANVLDYISSGTPYTVSCATSNATTVQAINPNLCFKNFISYLDISVFPITDSCFSFTSDFPVDSLDAGCMAGGIGPVFSGATFLNISGTDFRFSDVSICSPLRCQILRFVVFDETTGTGGAINSSSILAIGEPVYATNVPFPVASSFGTFKKVKVVINTASGPVIGYVFEEVIGTCTKIVTLITENLTTFCTAQINDPPNEHIYPEDLDALQQLCIQQLLTADTVLAMNHLAQLKESFASQYINMHYHKCFSSPLSEDFFVKYLSNEYHYTLYYYDQAGNLTQTVPPNGYNPVIPSAFNSSGVYNNVTMPAHTFLTRYTYNSLNQVVTQQTPDGGLTSYYYDDKGRLRFSQNAKQLPNNEYSYTIYDALSRIVEVGQSSQLYTGSTPFYNGVGDLTFPSTNRTQVTRTYYDAAPGTAPSTMFNSGAGQKFLRTRVSGTELYENAYDGTTQYLTFSSFFSYDEHGNVDELVQDNKLLASLGTDIEYKYMKYKYELVSGNVKQVSYQPGKVDQFYHKYIYDADNRLKIALTSNDGAIWEKDAKYFYYKHGPLARTEVGEDKVQGTDFAYTLNGWLKGINSTTVVTSRDMGKDANLNGTAMDVNNNNNLVGADALGFTLGYFSGDYASVGGSTPQSWLATTAGTSLQTGASGSLYNGNIAHTTNAFLDNNQSRVIVMGKTHKYDQLNRLKNTDVYTNKPGIIDLVFLNNTFSGATTSTTYSEEFSYDANGNITTLNRYGNVGQMDGFTYNYTSGTNKLSYVTDVVSASTYCDDIDDQSAYSGSGNYTYDAIGNLKEDKIAGIGAIEWNVYGKVKSISGIMKLDCYGNPLYTPNIEYKYDPSGNRICKIVKPIDTGTGIQKTEQHWTYTYYSRDAQGNVMAVYNRVVAVVVAGESTVSDKMVASEHHIYGSSRIGIQSNSSIVGGIQFTTATVGYNADGTIVRPGSGISTIAADAISNPKRIVGDKLYELSNHLGNVMVTVTDKKIGINVSGLSTDAEYYNADVISAQDYYSFGTVVPGRSYVGASYYRYGFGTQEKDDEIYGAGNAYTAEYWEYDPRLGRRWNTDPLEELFVSESPYSVFSNDPINLNDPDGLAPSKGSGPFDPNKRRYRPGRHRNTHNSIGTIFMKSIGWFRQTFTDAKYLTMTYKAGRYKNSGWQTVGSGVVNSGEEDDYSLYSTGILNDKVAGDHLIKVNILTWNDNSPDKRHNSFVSVKGLRRGIGDSHPKYRGLHTNTGVTPWTSDVPFGSGTSNIIPMLDALYDIFEKAENIVMFFSPKAMDFFSQYQAFILAGVLANRNLNPAYYHTSHLRVQNHYSNVPIGYTLQVRSRNWKKKTNNSRLWKKLHRH